jgi:hypothetical protein
MRLSFAVARAGTAAIWVRRIMKPFNPLERIARLKRLP